MKTISCEPFLYGKRLKAILTTLQNDKGLRLYKAKLYTYGDKPYKKKLFFNYTISPTDYKAQNNLYLQAYNYCNDWLQSVKY